MATVYTAIWDTETDVTLESFADWDWVDYNASWDVLAVNDYPDCDGNAGFYTNNHASIPKGDSEVTGLIWLADFSDAYVGWIFRWYNTDDDGYLLRAVRDTGQSILRFDDGTPTTLDSDAQTGILAETEYTMVASGQSSTLAVQVTGFNELSTTDANYSSGDVGLGGYRTSEVRSWAVDNLNGGANFLLLQQMMVS